MANYNLKSIMLGIGIGLVFSSVININMSSKELSVEEIKMEAVKHNLIVLSQEEILNNQTSIDEPAITPADAPTPTKTSESVETSPVPAPKPTVSEKKNTVEVISGMSSEVIADLLKERGIIEDTNAFLIRLNEVDKDDKLRVGKFEIPKGSDYDDIISIMTR